jgi:hypothetical protein
MGTSYNPKIVTDGLVLNLDAANRKSYPGAGTSWVDLTKNKFNGTINRATYSSSGGGTFSFLPANTANISISNFSVICTSATFSAWIYRDTSLAAYAGIMYSRAASAHGMDTHETSNNNLTYTWNNAANTYGWDSGITIPLQQWIHVSLVVSPTSAIYYINSILRATNTVSHASATFSTMNIGLDNAAARYFSGNIAMCQFYNRALTSAEVYNNFVANRGRFGV